MVLSLYLSKLLVTKRSTMDDLPVPLSPSSTTLTCGGSRGGGGGALEWRDSGERVALSASGGARTARARQTHARRRSCARLNTTPHTRANTHLAGVAQLGHCDRPSKGGAQTEGGARALEPHRSSGGVAARARPATRRGAWLGTRALAEPQPCQAVDEAATLLPVDDSEPAPYLSSAAMSAAKLAIATGA